jgi:hypothetical protein
LCKGQHLTRHRSHPKQTNTNAHSADRGGGDGGFTAGFVTGAVVFGALGFLFAPQISRALLGNDASLRLPRLMEEDSGPKDPEATKQELIDKIAQLNSSIDDVAAQLKAKDAEPA